MRFGQFASTSQFYLYGRRHCTKTGYERARDARKGPDILEHHRSMVEPDGRSKVAMVTGANSGVGFEIAKHLAVKGAEVYMVCRSAKRGAEAVKAVVEASGKPNVHLLVCDCSLEADVRAMWASFCEARGGAAAAKLDVLVCNAGVLLNERTLTTEGVETTFACHLLFGTYLLGELAMPALERAPGSRVVVVSSGGMYNTKFPAWAAATAQEGEYSGNLAYAYAKRGQVLLCERWSEQHPTVKFVSSHPGWTLTPAVDAAYGDLKKYLEPMRSPWEGAEGIAWLCVAEQEQLTAGAFYLDRKEEPKHLAGPFFTEGSFTKNTAAEVDEMMASLQQWSSRGTRPSEAAAAAEAAEAAARLLPLRESSAPIDIPSFMGRWYVVAQIPTPFDRGARNSTEDYSWDDKAKRIDVTFRFQRAGKGTKGKDGGAAAAPTTLLQRATISNAPTNTRWALSPKLLLYLPLHLAYLVLDCAPDYSTTIIGAPDRSAMYVMARRPAVAPEVLEELLSTCRRCGYDTSKVELVPQEWPEETPGEGADGAAGPAVPTTPTTAAAAVA